MERDLREVYDGRLFYGKDAFEGLHTMDQLMEGKKSGVLDPDFGRALGGRILPPRRSEMEAERAVTAAAVRSDVATDVEIFTPAVPRLPRRQGHSRSTTSPPSSTRPRCSATSGSSGPTSRSARTTPSSRSASARRSAAQLDEAKAEGWLVPAVIWGYFPVNADGNDLIVWTDDDRRNERLRFTFPRQRSDRHLCIADFFRSVESPATPTTPRSTSSPSASAPPNVSASCSPPTSTSEYLLTHGLSVEMTEALAELWHRRIREEWGFANEDGPTLAGLFRQQYRGSRYSWGYPACPDLDDQAKLDDLLELHRIGVKLTEEFQLEPEQSTSAIIVPHPEAKYFVV